MKGHAWKMTSVMLAVLIMAGCSNNAGNNANKNTGTSTGTGNTATAVKKDVTLTYLASQGYIKDSEMQLAKKFEEETGIAIDYQIVPSDQYFNVLKTKLNSKEGPDLFGGQSGQSEIKVNYNVAENAVDLSDQEWIKRMDPLSVKQVSLDDKVYALTIWDTSNSFVIAYNKKIFAEQGLSIPKTYEEFKQACLKIQKAGVTPIYEPIADGWHHVLWFTELGPRFEELQPNLYDDLNSNKVKFSDDKTMQLAMTQLKEMYDLGFFGDNTFSDVGAETANKLGSGEFAMSLTAQSTLGDIVKAFPEQKAEDYGYFVIPLADNQIYYVNPGGPSKFIYSGSKHIDEAKQYLTYLAKQENLQYMLDNDDTIFNLNFTGLKDKYTEQQKEMFTMYPKQGTDMQNYINYVNPQWMDIGKDITALLGNAAKPEDVLKNIDKRRTDMAVIAKDPDWSK